MTLFIAILALFCSTAWSVENVNDVSAVHQKLMNAMHEHIVRETGTAGEDVDVQWLGYAANIPCAETADVWVNTLPGEQFRGQTTARVTFVDATGVCGKLSVPFRATFWSEVPVATNDTQPGEVVAIGSARMLVSDVRGIVVDVDAGPWISVGSLRKGEAVTHRRVKRQPVASVGESIEIVATYGPLTVSAEGRMLADAFLGDSVRVANLATDAVVQGVLVSPGIVRAGVRK